MRHGSALVPVPQSFEESFAHLKDVSRAHREHQVPIPRKRLHRPQRVVLVPAEGDALPRPPELLDDRLGRDLQGGLPRAVDGQQEDLVRPGQGCRQGLHQGRRSRVAVRLVEQQDPPVGVPRESVRIERVDADGAGSVVDAEIIDETGERS